MSHKITVICDHGDSGGLVLAVIAGAVFLFGSGAAAAIGSALMTLFIVAGIVAAALAALGIVIAVLVWRHRRARGIRREGLSALWRPVITPAPVRPALPPGRPAYRPAAVLAPRELPRGTVIRGQAEPAPAPVRRGGRHAPRP